jgi:hypothetical protein
MNVTADAGEKSYIVVDGLTFERTAAYGIYFYSSDVGGVGSSGIVQNNTVLQTGTGQVDDGSCYNAIHSSQAVQLPTAPRFVNNVIWYAGGHGNAINAEMRTARRSSATWRITSTITIMARSKRRRVGANSVTLPMIQPRRTGSNKNIRPAR